RCADPGAPAVADVGEHAVEPDLPWITGVDGDAGVVAPAVAALAVDALRVAQARLEQGAALQLAERVGGGAAGEADRGVLARPAAGKHHRHVAVTVRRLRRVEVVLARAP